MSSQVSDVLAEGHSGDIYKRVTLRLLPFLFICYFFAYLNRVNVGFAKLQMASDLQFSEAVYGLGAGIFFIGYFLFEVPSNLMLRKVGARRWIARIMLTWGVLSVAMMFVTTPTSFYIVRFLLGAAEAGFFPGIILYLTYWYPSVRRGRITAIFMAAIPVSGLIGAPLSGLILDLAQGGGLHGWQWLFLIEGVPTVLLGVAVLFLLPNGPQDSKWLTDAERTHITQDLANDTQAHTSQDFGAALKDSKVWILSLIYFCIQMGVYAISFWLPTIVKTLGFASASTIGWISAVPYLAATFFMLYLGRSADLRRERRWHLIVPLLMGGVGLAGSVVFATSPALAILFLTIATMGFFTALPMFWPLPSAFLGGTAAAGGLALINSFGNLAGFCSPYLVGWVKDATASTDIALFILMGGALLGAILVLTIPPRLVNR